MCIPMHSQHLWQQRYFFRASIEMWQNFFPEFIDTQLQTAAQLAHLMLIVRSMSARIKAISFPVESVSPRVCSLHCTLGHHDSNSISTILWSHFHTCVYTVNWKIFVLKIFCKKKFHVKKISSYGWAKLLTRWLKGDVIWTAREFDCVCES